MYKDTKWAREILESQHEDGLWASFHTLSEPREEYHTEQALRRLEILGYTISDPCIRKTVNYMNECLKGSQLMPDRVEKSHNWDIFTRLMLATWIRRYSTEYPEAEKVANLWAAIITKAFAKGHYSHDDYIAAYESAFSEKIKGDRFIDFVSFYHVSLLVDKLTPSIEEAYISYIMSRDKGIYYLGYNKSLFSLPDKFESKQASRFIANIEMLAKYKSSKGKFKYVIDWLDSNKDNNNQWDMGSSVKDFIYLPLSDSWQKKEIRRNDITHRIKKLLSELDA